MGKLEMRDECMDPDRYVRFKYTGPNPFSIVKKIDSSIKPFFHISSSNRGQPLYKIDTSGDPFKFYSQWYGKLKVSAYSYILLNFEVEGSQSKRDKTGTFSFKVWGFLETSFKGRNILLKPFYLLYSYLFYDNARRNYIKRCQNLMLNFGNYLKDYYNIGKTKIPEHGAYG